MLRYTLIDYTIQPSGIATPVDEPVGLDTVHLRLKRDSKYHGFYDYVDDSIGSLRWYGVARDILAEAYARAGAYARVEILMEYDCADTGQYEELYRGEFDYSMYREIRGTDCYVESQIQNAKQQQLMRNRMETKISLDSLSSFDSPHIALAPYAPLGQNIILPSKTVHVKNYAQYSAPAAANQRDSNTGIHTNWVTDLNNLPKERNQFQLDPTIGNGRQHQPCMFTPYSTIVNQELLEFPGGVGEIQYKKWFNDQTTADFATEVDHIFEYKPENDFVSNDVRVRIHLNLFVANMFYNSPFKLFATVFKGKDFRKAVANGIINSTTLLDGSNTGGVLTDRDPTGGNTDHLYADVFTYDQDLTLTFQQGERLYVIFGCDPMRGLSDKFAAFFSHAYTWYSYNLGGAEHVHTFTADESYIKIDLATQVTASPAKVYLVNEALSRAAEIISNDEIRVYSDYFGRADAQPYPSAVDGDGALACLTNGLLIRNYNYATSLQYDGSNDVRVETSNQYTINAQDDKTKILFDNTNAVSLSIPADPSNSIFAIGAQILLIQGGAGVVTIVRTDPSIKIHSPNGVYTTSSAHLDQYGYEYTAILLTKVGVDEWLLSTRAAMFTTFKEMMESLHAIHAVGMGVEPDPNPGREGKVLMRIEPISYFYQDNNVIATCTNVDQIEIEVDRDQLVTTVEKAIPSGRLSRVMAWMSF
jgi:hypothetical protein